MNDTPEAVAELATEIYAAMRDGESEKAIAVLLQALMAERQAQRERDASILEASVRPIKGPFASSAHRQVYTDGVNLLNGCLRDLAVLIRKGDF